MQKILGGGIPEPFLDMLEGLRVAEIEVHHVRPLLVGPRVLTSENRDELKPAFEPIGLKGRRRKSFSGAQMERHKQQARDDKLRNRAVDRYYFDQHGGRTKVTLAIGNEDFEGTARCSGSDLFVKAEGRRIALCRAIVEASTVGPTSAIPTARDALLDALLMMPKCTPHSVAGPRPKGGKTAADYNKLAEGFDFKFALMPPPRPFGSSPLFTREMLESLMPPMPPRHVRLADSAAQHLELAEQTEEEALAPETLKVRRKQLRRQAWAHRQQAVAEAEVSYWLSPEGGKPIGGKQSDKVVFDEFVRPPGRNEG